MTSGGIFITNMLTAFVRLLLIISLTYSVAALWSGATKPISARMNIALTPKLLASDVKAVFVQPVVKNRRIYGLISKWQPCLKPIGNTLR